MNAPHTRGECDFCRLDLGDVVMRYDDSIGHEECVIYHRKAIYGPDAMPLGRAVRLFRRDPTPAFLERLGREAARLGIDRQRLAAAIERARHAT